MYIMVWEHEGGYEITAINETVQGDLAWRVQAKDGTGATLAVAHYLGANLHGTRQDECPACQKVREAVDRVDAMVAERWARISARGKGRPCGEPATSASESDG